MNQFLDDDLKQSAYEELRRINKEFYATGEQRFTKRWEKFLIANEVFGEIISNL
jgi:hypothetical protein